MFLRNTAMLLIVCGFAATLCGSAMALTPVMLNDDCGYVYNEFEDTPPGFDAMAEQILFILTVAEMELPTEDWATADLESVDYEINGDGIPDSYQLAMLGAALCAGDPEITSDFTANVAQFDHFVDQLLEGIELLTALGSEMNAAKSQLTSLMNSLLEDPELVFATSYLFNDITDTADSISEYSQVAGIIGDALPEFSEWFAAFAGTSDAARDTIDDLTWMVVGYIQSYCSGNPISYTNLAAEAANLRLLANNITTPLPADVKEDFLALADQIDAYWDFAEQVTIPYFTIYGTASKSATEPFSAEGDYNGDGLSNKEAYDLVTAAGGGREAFVQAAASDNGFWQGNPALPVAAMPALCALAAGLLAVGGIRLRKDA